MIPNTIHIIFKTHLDIGYTNFARNVTRQYFDVFIPKAISVAESLRQRGGPEKLIWTTGSWLIYEALEQGDAGFRARVESAIQAGDLAWHGLPCTFYSDLLDPSLFTFGLSLAGELDQRFGRKSIAAKMTDVPGHTRGIVPLLADAGIQFLHIGVNPASTPPDVPPIFVWRDEPSGRDIIAMYHKGSYGELALVPGSGEAIYFAHTNDNLGPPSEDEVIKVFSDLQARFPQAKVIASTMDNFAKSLAPIKESLPVLTGEIGNSWIHGVGTDPKKVAQLRELMRLRRDWLKNQRLSKEDTKAINTFSRQLLLVAEHTWGMDEKEWLADTERYDRKGLKAMRQEETCQTFEASWQEQRDYISLALNSLDETSLANDAHNHLAALEPQQPDKTDYERVVKPSKLLESDRFYIGINLQGEIITLVDKVNNMQWAGSENPLGSVRYEIFSQADYDRFYQQYIINKRQTAFWAIPDFTKPGMNRVNPPHQIWQPNLTTVYSRQNSEGLRCLLELESSSDAVETFGCPQIFTIEYFLPNEKPNLEITLQWFNKAANRLPEAIWFGFQPRLSRKAQWYLDKASTIITPRQPVRNSERHLHAIGQGLWCADGRHRLAFTTFDAPLVSLGKTSLLNYTNLFPSSRDGIQFNLYNNLWGTNHPMWYEEDARFRFTLKLERV